MANPAYSAKQPLAGELPSRERRSVLLVGNFLHARAGVFGVCEGLAAQLTATGWNVVTTSHYPQRLVRLVDILTTIWRHRREYEVAQIDVYSGRAFFLAEASCALLRRIGRPYVLTLHGGALPEFAARYPKRVAHLLSSAAAVTTPSEYLRAALSPYRADLILQPNPIPLEHYRFRPRVKARPVLLWVRAFHETYNPTMAIRAVAHLRERFPDVELLMVGPDRGDGTYQATVKLAEELGVQDRVKFAGQVPKPQLPAVFDRCDIFLNTSNIDNTPVTVVEAMASGLCVVSTSVGGIPYLLRDGHDGLLVGRDDAEQMAHAAARVVTTPILAQQLSRAGRRNAEARDWSLLLPQWERLLSSVSGS